MRRRAENTKEMRERKAELSQNDHGYSLSKCSQLVNLSKVTDVCLLFVGTDALRAEILMLKAQICIYLQIRALAFWPTKIPEEKDL